MQRYSKPIRFLAHPAGTHFVCRERRCGYNRDSSCSVPSRIVIAQGRCVTPEIWPPGHRCSTCGLEIARNPSGGWHHVGVSLRHRASPSPVGTRWTGDGQERR